jgi:hypothetical protein
LRSCPYNRGSNDRPIEIGRKCSKRAPSLEDARSNMKCQLRLVFAE